MPNDSLLKISSDGIRQFTLTGPQTQVFLCKERFRVLVAGRRFGKTILALVELIQAAVNKPKSRNWYVAPTYRMAKQIAWQQLKEFIPLEARLDTNEADLSFKFKHNGSEVALRGADNYDSLRGVGLDFLILDEVADIEPIAWRQALRPALSDRRGRGLFIGTPKGTNWFYDMWVAANEQESWAAFQFTTEQGGNVPADEILSAKLELPEYEFRQEYGASFENPTGRVYYEFDRRRHLHEDLRDASAATLRVGMDFNVNPMSAVVGLKNGGQLHIIREFSIANGNTDMLCTQLRKVYGQERDIWVYPDPSGRARKTSAPVGTTDFSILRSHGMRLSAPWAAPPVVDRVNTVNSAFRQNTLLVNPKCKQLVKALEGLTYLESATTGSLSVDKRSGLDHMTDALGYLVWRELPMRNREVEVNEFNI